MVPKWCFDVEIGSSGQSERGVGRSREIAGLPNGQISYWIYRYKLSKRQKKGRKKKKEKIKMDRNK